MTKNMDHKRNHTTRQEAFTLVELLLGLVIFSIISMSIYGVFWGGIKLDSRAETQNQVFREVRMTFDLIEKELENMIFYDFSESHSERSSFSGEINRITFLTSGNDGVNAVSYYLEDPQAGVIVKTLLGDTYTKNVNVRNQIIESERANCLIREEKGLKEFLGSTSSDSDLVEIIAMHVKESGLRFYYGTSQEEQDEVIWQERWDFDYLPSHIKVEIDFLLGGKTKTIKTFEKKIIVPSGFLGIEE